MKLNSRFSAHTAQPLLGSRRGPVRKGVAALEAAILGPFLVVIFFVTVDFARIFYYQMVLNECARNGAIFNSNLKSYQETGWVNPSNDVYKATIASGTALSPALATSQVSVSTGTGSDGNNNTTVTVSYPFQTIVSYPGYGNTFNLTATVKMRQAP